MTKILQPRHDVPSHDVCHHGSPTIDPIHQPQRNQDEPIPNSTERGLISSSMWSPASQNRQVTQLMGKSEIKVDLGVMRPGNENRKKDKEQGGQKIEISRCASVAARFRNTDRDKSRSAMSGDFLPKLCGDCERDAPKGNLSVCELRIAICRARGCLRKEESEKEWEWWNFFLK